MLERASSPIRKLAVECRSQALLGDPAQALGRIDERLQIVATDPLLDRIVLLMAKVEILFLDCRDEEALRIYTDELDDWLQDLPEDVVIAMSYNRNDIALAIFEPDDFYAALDRSRIADVDLWDYRAFYAGREAAAAGRHYDALPVVWQALLRAHNQGCWRPFRAASRLMALECLQLGWPQKAVYYAIIAQDKEAAQQIGQWLLMNGTPDSLQASVNVLLDCASLKRPFVTACHIVSEMHDAIPDAQVDLVVRWLMEKASITLESISERETGERAWELLAKIAARADVAQAQAIAEAATAHDVWGKEIGENQVLPLRRDMVNAIRGCADKIPVTHMEGLARSTVPLVLQRRQGHDYVEGIELICHLAEIGGTETKKFVRDQLYPRGSSLNSILLQVAAFFDVELEESDQLTAAADRVAQRIRLQVQRVPSGEEITQISGSFGHSTVELGNETLYVHMVNSTDLEAMVCHRHHLEDGAVDSLIDAVAAMVSERENLIANKIALIHPLAKVGDICSAGRASKLLDMLLPLAKGEFLEPIHAMSSAEAANPLNPFKMNFGKPAELRGVALNVLACIERDRPGTFGESLDSVLEIGLMDLDSDIRSWAYTAARQLPTLTESQFTALILGTQDDDPRAAAAAFLGIAEERKWSLQDSQWRLLIQAVSRGAQSPAVGVRQGAALTCARLVDSIPEGPMRGKMTELRAVLSGDRCYSVRRSACE